MTIRVALRMLSKRCREAIQDSAKREDVSWGLTQLLESDTATAAFSPGRLGQLEHLKQRLDVAEAEHSPETIAELAAALRAFLDEELGKFGEKKGTSMTDNNESWECEACGALNESLPEGYPRPEDGPEAMARWQQAHSTHWNQEPETSYFDAGIKRGADLARKTAATAYELPNDEFVQEADMTDEQAAQTAAHFDEYNRYAKEGEANRASGLSAYAKRRQASEMDEPPHSKYLVGESNKRKHESMREGMRNFNRQLRASLRERVVILPRHHSHAQAVVESLRW